MTDWLTSYLRAVREYEEAKMDEVENWRIRFEELGIECDKWRHNAEKAEAELWRLKREREEHRYVREEAVKALQAEKAEVERLTDVVRQVREWSLIRPQPTARQSDVLWLNDLTKRALARCEECRNGPAPSYYAAKGYCAACYCGSHFERRQP
jgi:chromosome segregation ATPase